MQKACTSFFLAQELVSYFLQMNVRFREEHSFGVADRVCMYSHFT